MLQLHNDDIKRTALARLEWLSYELDAEADSADTRPIAEIREESRALGADVDGLYARLQKIIERASQRTAPPDWREFIAEVYWWVPKGAGLRLTATAIGTQERSFEKLGGIINIACNWGSEQGDDPAYIWLSWDAKISEEREFRIRFINPDNQSLWYELCPGRIHKGEQTIPRQELGFHPCQDKWAIAIV